MAGFASSVSNSVDCVYANNADFSGNSIPADTNGLQTNGQLWIGSTAVNAGNTHINVGSITSPNGTLTIGYASPNITIDLVGGSTGIDSIAVQAGTTPITPTAAGLVTINGSVLAQGTGAAVRTFGNSANTFTTQVQIANKLAATDATQTQLGLSVYDSASFSVDANGFVTMAGGSGFTWSDKSGTFTAAKNNGYFITGTATANLPASPSNGDSIKFFVDHASQVLTIQASGTQIIRLSTAVTAAAGTAVSTAQGDSVELVYRITNTAWEAVGGFSGVWTLT